MSWLPAALLYVLGAVSTAHHADDLGWPDTRGRKGRPGVVAWGMVVLWPLVAAAQLLRDDEDGG